MDDLSDWKKLATVWECYENMGASPKTLGGISHRFKSPMLVVGSGAGTTVEFIKKQGYSISAVDSCKEMIELSKKLRNIEAIHSDIRQTPFSSNSFDSILVNTGVLFSPFLYDEYLDATFNELNRLLKPGAELFLTYFQEEDFLADLCYIFKHLQLDVTPSNNICFLGAESLIDVKKRFLCDTNIHPPIIEYIFETYNAELIFHLDLIRCIERKLEANNIEPFEYVSNVISFKYYDLTSRDREYLKNQVVRYFDFIDDILLSDNETRVILASKK